MPVPADPRSQIDSYLICSTPRTGSTLLCGLLASTGVAGRPESYFRSQGQQEYAVRWGIVRSPDGDFSYADYLRAALAAGRTGNGVWAARMMWETMEEVTGELATINPDLSDNGVGLLACVFGRLHFVYLQAKAQVSHSIEYSSGISS